MAIDRRQQGGGQQKPRSSPGKTGAKIVALGLVIGCARNVMALEQELSQFLAAPGVKALDVYQRYISPAKGSSCPMEPSDSSYARQAIHRYGLFRAVLMTADRLHRCGHDVEHYPMVRTSRGLKYADPVNAEEPLP